MKISNTFLTVCFTRQHTSLRLMEPGSPVTRLDAEGLKDGSGSKGSGMATKKLVCKGRN